MLHFIAFLLSFFVSVNAFSDNSFFKCLASKVYLDDYEPKVFNSSNNLLSNYQQNASLNITLLVIKGRVLQSNCQPLVNAKVFAWQVGLEGKYPYLPLRSNINRRLINLGSNLAFQGSATATTNNMGEFVLITMRPASRINYMNLRIKTFDKVLLQTRIFLDNSSATVLYKNSDNDSYYTEIVVPAFD
jgi:protocatechuate 3,4-dioxygenase beta subunit